MNSPATSGSRIKPPSPRGGLTLSHHSRKAKYSLVIEGSEVRCIALVPQPDELGLFCFPVLTVAPDRIPGPASVGKAHPTQDSS